MAQWLKPVVPPTPEADVRGWEFIVILGNTVRGPIKGKEKNQSSPERYGTAGTDTNGCLFHAQHKGALAAREVKDATWGHPSAPTWPPRINNSRDSKGLNSAFRKLNKTA